MSRHLFTFALFACACLAALVAHAQPPVQQPTQQPAQPTASPTPAAPPDVDIFLVELTNRAGALTFGQPVNITKRAGYDNQPSFLPDGQSLLYTSQRDGQQTDIYRYNLQTGATTQLTATPESEYSPTVMPAGKTFSVVRVEADKTQRLWQFPLAGGSATLALENVKPVGYHLWLDARTLALFVLGDEQQHMPHTLQLVTLAKDRPQAIEVSTLHVNIGRSLQRRPGRAPVFSFVHKVAADNWLIKLVDVDAHKTTTLVKTLPGSEDLAWLPDGTLLMASGAKLYRLDPTHDTDWRETADFTAAGLTQITRLALNPKGDRLALVAQAAAKP
jgi:dipeptidyl aminopeptidase/acylaminoacyl peptidase